MDYTTLGRTGLRVSVMGLGAGGPSRLGRTTGNTEEQSLAVIRRALELGVNFIDTAEAYGTEPVVGRAIKGVSREQVIISTKKSLLQNEVFITPQEMIDGVEASLQRLDTDYIDVFHLHGVRLEHYERGVNEIVPALLTLREQGKIRFLGITEGFGRDTRHRMLERALQDDCWDVVMVGFNLLNQSALEKVFPMTMQKDIGVLIMFAVRRALSNPDKLRALMADLKAQGLVDPAQYDEDDPLGFLVREGGATSVVDAAYRFCRYEPGVHVVLSGTGNIQHLEANAESLSRPPLPEAEMRKLRELFARVDNVSGN